MTTVTASPLSRNLHALVAAIVTVVPVISAPGAVLLSDDFEGYTAGTSLGTTGPWGTASGDSSLRIVRDENTATPFGTPNQYVDFADASTVSGIRVQSPDIAAASAAVTTLSFDFLEPSTGGGDVMTVGYAMAGQDLNAAGSRLRLNLDDGLVTGLSTTVANSYSLDAAYTLYIIFNDTAGAVSYVGGTVAAGTADVWLEALGSGSPVYAGSVAAINTQTASYRVGGFRVFNAALQTVQVDNVSLVEGAAVPEPSAGLLGLAALLLAMRRRR